MKTLQTITLLASILIAPSAGAAEQTAAPDFNKDVAPILRKYCAGCHNDQDREGKLSVDSFDALLKGGERGSAITPGNGDVSRLIRVLTGKAEPKMPPKDNEAPKPAEIAILNAWIDAGAKGPTGRPAPVVPVTPKIALKAPPRDAVHAVVISPAGNFYAIARHGEAELYTLPERKMIAELKGHSGSVNALAFSADGNMLAAAGGEPNLFGEVRLWKAAELVRALANKSEKQGSIAAPRVIQGHRDSLYAVRFSPDGKFVATGGYDQKIKLWDVATGKEVKTFEGHNGAVFDLAFRPDGKILASASGDRTIKLWNVETAQRLDTLNQSLQELYTVAFSPDGKRVAGGGVDNRIRVWSVSETAQEGTNPLLYSQFAHELPILRLAYSADGKTIVSTAEDRLIKIWDADTVTIRETLPPQKDWAVGLAILPQNTRLLAGLLDGTVAQFDFAATAKQPTAQNTRPLDEVPAPVDYGEQPALDKLPVVAEVEPNDASNQATAIKIPGVAKGTIMRAVVGAANNASAASGDVDLFSFEAKAGDQWILEIDAARSGSDLDSKLEILFADGRPVPRALLRAVRDTEIEFRSMDSTQRGVRLKNWEEMLLNEYVYLNGEVIKHYQQRRGPDADGNFYPENGQRFTFFETSGRAHALGEPGYVVVPYPIGTQLPNNGLPVFTLNYENDDDSQRKLGRDSRLTFVAPTDGAYLARVSDVRGLSGEKFSYKLIVRRPRPDFKVTLTGANPTIGAGSGKQFVVKAERIDNFMEKIRVDVSGLPPGFAVSSPITIAAGLYEAKGVINALPTAAAPKEMKDEDIKVTATAEIFGKPVSHGVNGLGKIKLADKPKLVAYLEPDPANKNSVPAIAASDVNSFPQPAQVTIIPGQRTTCRLRVERNDFAGRVQFDVENLPHGVIVDDIGLSGVLVVEGQTERVIFLACEPWVPETSRLFHALAKVEGEQVTLPMLLHVRRPDTLASQSGGN